MAHEEITKSVDLRLYGDKKLYRSGKSRAPSRDAPHRARRSLVFQAKLEIPGESRGVALDYRRA